MRIAVIRHFLKRKWSRSQNPARATKPLNTKSPAAYPSPKHQTPNVSAPNIATTSATARTAMCGVCGMGNSGLSTISAGLCGGCRKSRARFISKRQISRMKISAKPSPAGGKSTLVNVLHGLLGPYALALPENYFLVTKNATDFATANIAGVRLATCVETNEGRRLDVAKIKTLTGEDVISAALKYENYFEFRPQAKLVLATNHRPHVPATDDSIWRRVKVVPFNISVPEDKRVPELAKRFLE